jgi:hypothetical protein
LQFLSLLLLSWRDAIRAGGKHNRTHGLLKGCPRDAPEGDGACDNLACCESKRALLGNRLGHSVLGNSLGESAFMNAFEGMDTFLA